MGSWKIFLHIIGLLCGLQGIAYGGNSVESIVVKGVPWNSLERYSLSQTTITRSDIEKMNVPTVVEALQTIPGLYVARTGGRGGQASIFMRGSRNGDTLLLIDGVPVADPSQIGGSFQLDHLTLFQVERIEILKGPRGLA